MIHVLEPFLALRDCRTTLGLFSGLTYFPHYPRRSSSTLFARLFLHNFTHCCADSFLSFLWPRLQGDLFSVARTAEKLLPLHARRFSHVRRRRSAVYAQRKGRPQAEGGATALFPN